MKRKGFTLIESVISMAIVLILITFAFVSKNILLKLDKEKVEIKEDNIIVNFIENEINFNMTFIEVKNYFEVDNDRELNKTTIISELKSKNFEDLSVGEGIKLKLRYIESDRITYTVKIEDREEIEIIRERWLDEIK